MLENSAAADQLSLSAAGALKVFSIADMDGSPLWGITGAGVATFASVSTPDQNPTANRITVFDNVGVAGGGSADQYTITDTDTGSGATYAHFAGTTKVMSFTPTTATLGPGTGATCMIFEDLANGTSTAVWTQDGVLFDEVDTDGICDVE